MNFCSDDNAIVNCNGPMTLGLTRPLHAFFGNPHTVYQRHDQKPAGDKPPPPVIPIGPQIGPGFRPIVGYALPTYLPGAIDDGWVPGGPARRLGA